MVFIRVLLLVVIPISVHANEVCVKYMEADMEFSPSFSTMISDEFETVFIPGLKKYGEAYMDIHPGGRKSKDDKINLKLAIAWRDMVCPEPNFFWNQTTLYFWNLHIYMNENDRTELACRRLTRADQGFIQDYPTDKSDFFYEQEVKLALRDYASDHIEGITGLGLVQVSRDSSKEEALRKVIEFHNAKCSGKHHWTDKNFAHWKKVMKK